MAARLIVGSKRALLEQATRVRDEYYEHSDVFVKFLLLNRSFIKIGRFYGITQLFVVMDSMSVNFCFGSGFSARTNYFRFTIDEALKLIEFFEVKLLKMHSVFDCGDRLESYWRLIDVVQGKIDLEFEDVVNHESCLDLSRDVVNGFWGKITSLKGPANLLRSELCQPHKHFDRLSAISVHCIGDLKRILRHDVDEMEIDFIGPYFMQDDVDKILYTSEKITIKKCKLIRRSGIGEIDAIVPLVKLILGISPACKEIEVNISVPGSGVAVNSDEIVGKIARGYEIFNEAKAILGELSLKVHLSVAVTVDTSLPYVLQDFGIEWLSLLSYNNLEFLKAKYVVNDEFASTGDGIILETTDGLLTCAFVVGVNYDVEDDESEMDSDGDILIFSDSDSLGSDSD